ncbi:MAG: HlyD family efflux transporter periplasmic adaptor subunit [Deferribacteres bacterium]|nr:HlyD family efflux transporter periplasmic adaptor subunit [Deferribacteres bacterium]
MLKAARQQGPPEFSGTVQAREINAGSRIPGKIQRILVREGDSVNRGDVLVQLENREAAAALQGAEAELEAAGGRLKEARARLETARKRYIAAEKQADVSRAEYERMKITLEQARREMKRMQGLYEKGFVSKQELDIKQTAYNEAKALLSAAGSRVALARAELDVAASVVKTAELQIGTLKSRVREAGALVSLRRAQYEDTVITAPGRGVVVYRAFEEGETVAPYTTILTIVDMNDRWIRIDVDETYLPEIKPGAAAVIEAAGTDRKFRGRVFSIAREAEFATQRDVTRGRQDIKTFAVKLRVDDPDGVLKPGMTVRVRIQ